MPPFQPLTAADQARLDEVLARIEHGSETLIGYPCNQLFDCSERFQAISEDALVIRLRDEPGALARVAARFRDPQLNIRSMRVLRRDREFVLVTLVTSNNQQARAQLGGVLVGLSGREEQMT